MLYIFLLQKARLARVEDTTEKWEQTIPGPYIQGPAGTRNAGPQVWNWHAGMLYIV